MSTPKDPRHLWSGDWESESREPVFAPPVAAGQQQTDDEPTRVREAKPERPANPGQPKEPSKRGGSSRRHLGLIASFAVVAAVAVGAAALAFSGGDDSKKTSALPAATTSTVTPKAGQTQAGAIYAKASPAVVSIRTNGGSGTGFLVGSDGVIVTNAHVVDTATRVSVQFGAKGKRLDGEVAGTDPSSDLSVIRIDRSGIPSGVAPLKLADSSQVAVGDEVLAIGNPFGLDRTQTAGIVSGIGRDIQAPNGFQIADAIQTDAAINPGNSGGPLLDTSGHVVGVNSQIETSGTSSGNVGIGFAVPSNTVRSVVPVLKAGDTIERPWLGVTMEDDPATPGATVNSVSSSSSAADAGIKEGDVITKFNSKAITDSSTLSSLVAQAKTGDKVTITVQRGGQELELDATLRTRPATAP